MDQPRVLPRLALRALAQDALGLDQPHADDSRAEHARHTPQQPDLLGLQRVDCGAREDQIDLWVRVERDHDRGTGAGAGQLQLAATREGDRLQCGGWSLAWWESGGCQHRLGRHESNGFCLERLCDPLRRPLHHQPLIAHREDKLDELGEVLRAPAAVRGLRCHQPTARTTRVWLWKAEMPWVRAISP